MFRALVLFLLFMSLFSVGHEALAQSHNRNVFARAHVVNGDTIPDVRLGEVRVYARAKFKSKRQQRKWTRYIFNVKKALPYARLIARELKVINDSLAVITSDKAREDFLDRKEKDLFKKYEQPLKHLTVSQGRILIKLVDRETGTTSYELIRMLKGRFKAFWWQGIARIFGSNLKTEYDPQGEDKNLENVVILIDQGYY